MNYSGSIQVIFGPMFSGKSTQLLRKVKRFQITQSKCLIVNYSHDNRYTTEDMMSTHDKQMKKAIKCTKLQQIKSTYHTYDVIAIDQGQFFSDIVQMCQQMANNGKVVLVAGLDGTYQRKGFGNIINLLPLAQKITKLSAVCVYCHRDAYFTKRTIDNQEIELIGGQEIYKPVCRRCFIMPFNNKKQQKSQEFNVKMMVAQNIEKNFENLKL